MKYYKRKSSSEIELKYALEASNSSHLTPLFVAVSRSSLACVRVFVDEWPASKIHIDSIRFNYNIFHICCLYNSVEAFLYLLELIEDDDEEKMDEKEAETYYECSDFDNNENEEKEKDLIVVNATLGE